MIYQKLYQSAIYPLYHWLMKDGANAAIREIDRSEHLGRAEVENITLEKLRRLLAHARANVPYYHELLRDFPTTASPAELLDAFQGLPLLSKATINAHIDAMVSEDLEGNGLDSNSTSGSTGEKLIFYTDWRSGAYRKATVRRSQRWLGVMPGEPEVRLWGSPIDVDRKKSLRGRLHSMISRETMLSAYSMEQPTPQYPHTVCLRSSSHSLPRPRRERGSRAAVGHTWTQLPQNTHDESAIGQSNGVAMWLSKPRWL